MAMLEFLNAHHPTLQAISTLLGIVALLLSVPLFALNQLAELRLRRESGHRYVMELYQGFLDRCLQYPSLGLESAKARPVNVLTEQELLQRDILFDILTSIFERAHLTYADELRSHHKEQWPGWELYIDSYCQRPDYLEWWQRVMFEGGRVDASAKNITQYDIRFETFILKHIRRHMPPAGPASQ